MLRETVLAADAERETRALGRLYADIMNHNPRPGVTTYVTKSILDKTHTRYTRQHYDEVARILRKRQPTLKPSDSDAIYNLWLDMVMDFLDIFKVDNPRFKAKQFLKACGYPGEIPFD